MFLPLITLVGCGRRGACGIRKKFSFAAKVSLTDSRRLFSSGKKGSAALTKSDSRSGGLPSTTVSKVRAAGRDVSYLGVVLVGIGVTGSILYAVFRELFSGDSPNGVYSRAFKVVSTDSQVKDVLGAPIKGYGEATRRGRRRHVSHLEYRKDGEELIRMEFNVEGSREKGRVLLEMKKSSAGHYDEFRYLIVEVDGTVRRTLVLQDNRSL